MTKIEKKEREREKKNYRHKHRTDCIMSRKNFGQMFAITLKYLVCSSAAAILVYLEFYLSSSGVFNFLISHGSLKSVINAPHPLLFLHFYFVQLHCHLVLNLKDIPYFGTCVLYRKNYRILFQIRCNSPPPPKKKQLKNSPYVPYPGD